jgi:hypothetical protein
MGNTLDVITTCRQEVAHRGFAVIAMEGDRTGWDWAHTVGLHDRTGHPELVVVGLPASIAGALVEVVGEQVLDGLRLDDGDGLTVEPFRLRVEVVGRAVHDVGPWFDLGRCVLDTPDDGFPPVLQLLWADAAGSFPSPVTDLSVREPQPVLSARVVDLAVGSAPEVCSAERRGDPRWS